MEKVREHPQKMLPPDLLRKISLEVEELKRIEYVRFMNAPEDRSDRVRFNNP